MATVSVKQGSYLYNAGQPVKEIYLILKGSFTLSFPGGSYALSTGEIMGIHALYTGLHDMSCRANEDSTVVVLPITDLFGLETFLKESPDYSVLFLRSAFRQINTLLQLHELAQLTCTNLYTDFAQDYSNYQACCIRRNLTPVTLPSFKTLQPFVEETVLEPWSVAYYDGFLRLFSNNSSPLSKESGVAAGLLAGTCKDCQKILKALRFMVDYQQQVLSLYINEVQKDILKLYMELYEKMGPDSPEGDFLYNTLIHIEGLITGSPFAPEALTKQRLALLGTLLEQKQLQAPVTDTSFTADLTGSLDTILQYAGMDDAFKKDFKDLVLQYMRTTDKASSEDRVRELRLRITSAFYTLYSKTYFRTKEEPNLPLAVQLFLYFGYVDENLAGTENLGFLCQAAQIISKRSVSNIYTFYDWLNAIYNGQKEPCRNEFDEDYTDYIHAQKVTKKITAAEETALLADVRKKVEYELANMFPSVNKVTFGRISAFCPIFSAHNLLKRPDAAFVSEKELTQILSAIISIDFTAFYREYIYTNNAASIPKESLHLEILPDFILMPNIGTRGVMWQEIEGRKRSTPARMMLSAFYLEDLRPAIVRLTGEYRWEMCKRIQGARWNDVAERSLTSEYFDYIQFYKKNHDLSADTKEKIKSALQKARNSFKEMFVRDYITYIIYESEGSPRLTKPARTILFSYCPFASLVRNALTTSPIYKESVERYRTQLQQQLKKIDLLEKRVENTGVCVPAELIAERELLSR